MKKRMLKLVLTGGILLALVGCGYLHKKPKKIDKTSASFKIVEGLSMYATIDLGRLVTGEMVDPHQSVKFKLDFLPKNRFVIYDQVAINGSRIFATGVYQYNYIKNKQAVLVLDGYSAKKHDAFFLNFSLTFTGQKKGTFIAKSSEETQTQKSYQQSGTFMFHSY